MQSDRWPRYFPADLDWGRAEYFSLFLERMNEHSLYQAGVNQPFVVRFLCLPTWTPASCIRVEASGLSWRLVVKEMDGDAGFDVGNLIRSDDRLLTAGESNRIADLWDYLRFWLLSTEDGNEVFDGTTYVLEAAEYDRYHIAYRVDYEWGDPFGELCDLLFKLAGSKPR